MATGPELPVMGTAARRDRAIETIVKTFPTMESLFGELDFCECGHCQSVLSPAAYLVDILKFLDPDPDEWAAVIDQWGTKVDANAVEGDATFLPYPFPTLDAWNAHTAANPAAAPADTNKTPYDILVARRPDLPHLPLTCENALTALPYIDVVNEILEFYVTTTAPSDAPTWAELPAHDTGAATTAELLAEPQHTLRTAYDILSEATYPLILPFDLWLETSRRFFDHFRTPLWQALEIFRPSDELLPPNPLPDDPHRYYWSHIRGEHLGLAPTTAELFTRPEPLATWFELYGYESNDEAFTQLRPSAQTLARRLGVTYRELTDLLNTAFVNPNIAELVLLHKLEIRARDVVRYKLDEMDPDKRADFETRLVTISEAIGDDHPTVGGWLTKLWDDNAFDRLLILVPRTTTSVISPRPR